jgi:hypothetical protein
MAAKRLAAEVGMSKGVQGFGRHPRQPPCSSVRALGRREQPATAATVRAEDIRVALEARLVDESRCTCRLKCGAWKVRVKYVGCGPCMTR